MEIIRKTAGRPIGSPNKLCAITYPMIAKWAGLSIHTVRSYGSRGVFDPRSVEGVLMWVNTRRVAKGQKPIGMPRA